MNRRNGAIAKRNKAQGIVHETKVKSMDWSMNGSAWLGASKLKYEKPAPILGEVREPSRDQERTRSRMTAVYRSTK